MKSLFQTRINDANAHIWLLALRGTAASFMLTHGYPKFMTLIQGGEIAFMNFMGVGATVSLALAVFAEFFCSIFVILGLGTRLASIPVIITMLVAIFNVHVNDPFQKKELALLYLLIFSTLLILGGGKYSFDRFIGKA